MTEQQRNISFFLAAILALAGPASAVRKGRLIGKVLGPDDKPVAGVTVTATSPNVASFHVVQTTNKKGVFKLDFHRIDVVYRYRFEKVGYLTTEVEQSWSFEGTKRHEFNIQPGNQPRPDAPPPASKSNAAILAFNAGAAAFEAGDHAAAQAKLEEALGHDPELRQAWDVLAAVHVARSQHEAALAAADKAIALGSTDVLALRSRWQAYRALGDEAKATEAQEALERLGRLSDEANRIYNQGVRLAKAGDHAGALAKYREALEVDPNHEMALLGVMTSGLEADAAAEVIAAAESLLASNPGHEEALRLRYNASLKLGDEAKIVEALVGLARIEPAAARDRLFTLATTSYDADDAATAKKRFGEVLAVDPDHPRSHYLLGLLLLREGATADAKRHVARFVELAPDDPDAATARQIVAGL